MTMNKYGWREFVTPIVEKVMASSAEELLTLNNQMAMEGVPNAEYLQDPLPQPLPGIDPFTFLSYTACWEAKLSNKLPMIRFLEKYWGLPQSNCPEEEREFPMISEGSLNYLPFDAHERHHDDLSSLWHFATACYEGNDQEAGKLFLRCLKIPGIGQWGTVAKLTIGLFWLNPERYLSLDRYTDKFLEKHLISGDVKAEAKLSWKHYIDLCEKATNHFQKKPYQICCDVYTSK